MYLNANKQFKNYLIQEMTKTNRKINELYIRHLENIIRFSPVESDIDVLISLKCYSDLTYAALKETALQNFSPIFRTIIAKHDEQFQARCNLQIKALLDLERLYSYYIDSNRFFNDFDSLSNYLAKAALPLQDEFRVLNYYVNCSFNFILNESALSTKEGLDAYLNSAKASYDEISFMQLQEYLRSHITKDSYETVKQNFIAVYPLVNSQFDQKLVKYSVSDLCHLKLNLTLYQIVLLNYKDLERSFDFIALSEALRESEPENPGLIGVQKRILANPNSN